MVIALVSGSNQKRIQQRPCLNPNLFPSGEKSVRKDISLSLETALAKGREHFASPQGGVECTSGEVSPSRAARHHASVTCACLCV